MPELPTTFGKYFLTEKLATGGMAEIYLAKIVGPGGFEKQLVIKQIHPKLSGQRHFVDLFVAEAKTLVTLAHGNIVPVYELGVVDETYFIAMEYIDGPTLYRLTEALARREVVMDPAVAAWITARIVEGLDYAHRKGEGVIHRDLSPRNVMLSRDGEVKLVDFGIAVTLGAAGEGESVVQSAPTGSFPYMSPEQVRREALTGQTDLFSVGVLLWEMLVGHRLFARNDPDATLHAVTEGEIPRPSSERPEIPPKLDEVVMRALERDKTARWQSAGDMLAALQRYLYALDETPGPRDVAALVARYCPPETRRLPTHADAGGLDLAPDPSLPENTQLTPPPGAPPEGPRTAVIPRDGSQPRGKPRPIRHKSFATHIELKDMLDRATPMLGVEAIPDAADADAALATQPVAPATQPVAKAAAIEATKPSTPKSDPESVDTTMRIRARSVKDAAAEPPSRTLLVIGGLGATVLGIAALVMFLRGRDHVLAEDAGPRDASQLVLAPDASPGPMLDAPPVAIDAGALDDAPVDATASAGDASVPVARDAGIAVVRDAAAPRRDAGDLDAPARPTGTAILKIGADPWGEIVIDGVKRGRTPARIEVSAGRHSVEVIFAGEDPPRKKSYPVDLATGATHEIVADFTKP